MSNHANLKHTIIDFLESIGCVDVVEEHKITLPPGSSPGFVVVDVAARLPDGRSVAVECGSIHNMTDRLKIMAGNFDEMYWFPMMPFLFKLDRRDLDTFSRYCIQYVCKRCRYKWTPRRQNPKVCPNCKSRNWQEVPKKRRR